MEEILAKIEEQQRKIDAIYVSVEKTRKYFLWTLIITAVTVLLPLVVLMFILPTVINSITTLYGGSL